MALTAVLGVVAATTAATIVYGRCRGRVSRASLRRAAVCTLEYVGLASFFLVLNVCLGVVGVLVLRSITRYFVSVYVINDLLLVLLSVLQALFLGPLLLPPRTFRDDG